MRFNFKCEYNVPLTLVGQPIARNALTILVNIAGDGDVLHNLATDDAFVETLLSRVTVMAYRPSSSLCRGPRSSSGKWLITYQNPKEPNANEMAMLLANMAKDKSMDRLIALKRPALLGLSQSNLALDQLLDVFMKGAEGAYNVAANFDYLAYLFADLAQVSMPQFWRPATAVCPPERADARSSICLAQRTSRPPSPTTA